jgi:hypothetical protein
MCIGAVCGLLIGTVIGAVILRAACWLFNSMAGGDERRGGVPEPEFGRAMLITFVTFLVQTGVQMVIGFVTGAGAAAAEQAKPGAGGPAQLMASLIALPVGFLVMAGMLTAMLPTSFPKALLVALLEYVIIIIIAAIIIGGLILAFGGARFLGGQ